MKSIALILLISSGALLAQTAPTDVAACELAANPAKYHHQLLRINAFVTYGFEDFGLVDSACPATNLWIWLTFGGRQNSGVVYCCGGEGAADKRPQNLIIDKISLPLKEDSKLAELRHLFAKEGDTVVKVTLIGHFFAKDDTAGRAYGHLGCCSLLVIEQIEDFDPHDRADLDYTAEAGWYEVPKNACTYQWVRHASLGEEDSLIISREQKNADAGSETWRFSDPVKVASSVLQQYGFSNDKALTAVKESPIRKVYDWKAQDATYRVTVTKPYWLSAVAHGTHVIWAATMVHKVTAFCK
jgi:hypothetical protein